jgi:hypothetical protein
MRGLSTKLGKVQAQLRKCGQWADKSALAPGAGLGMGFARDHFPVCVAGVPVRDDAIISYLTALSSRGSNGFATRLGFVPRGEPSFDATISKKFCGIRDESDGEDETTCMQNASLEDVIRLIGDEPRDLAGTATVITIQKSIIKRDRRTMQQPSRILV